ncbi:DUF3540 domain-containing protein [Desulfogranum mediterraneum]|uniref:DUF3540 domain-containing protein n=1 Tax=Desulfogranum mediterraneum TaxID=160661 RepID=UPI0004297E81|nr:DUF3540 domain-containing protein [Desulfogranum mediterraneum]
MQQLNQTIEQPQPGLEYGTIHSADQEGTFRVAVSFGQIAAHKAAGCLLQPREGDLVLVSVDMRGVSYILTVLEQGNEERVSELVVPGDGLFHSQNGSLELRADQGLNLRANEEIEVAGDALHIHAHRAEACIGRISLVGRILYSQVERITTVAKSIEQSLRRLTQRMENSERFVQDHEEVQTGSSRYLVEETLTTQAGNTLNISEELHTIHAEQIHMS